MSRRCIVQFVQLALLSAVLVLGHAPVAEAGPTTTTTTAPPTTTTTTAPPTTTTTTAPPTTTTTTAPPTTTTTTAPPTTTTTTAPPTTTTTTAPPTTTTTTAPPTTTTTTAPPGKKVAVCHKRGRSGKVKTLNISVNAVPAHLGHGDTLGACDGSGSKKSRRGRGASSKRKGR